MTFPVTEHTVKTPRHTTGYLACGAERQTLARPNTSPTGLPRVQRCSFGSPRAATTALKYTRRGRIAGLQRQSEWLLDDPG